MIVLGIDPGTATTGYGVVRTDENGMMRVVDYGLIETSKDETPGKRLVEIHEQLANIIIVKHHPDIFVIEKLFFATNAKTAIRVGQAQGAMLMAAARHNLAVFEYSPMTIKKVVAGNGRAGKEDVQNSVRKYLGPTVREKKGKKTHFDNAADALAVAMCHIMQGGENNG